MKHSDQATMALWRERLWSTFVRLESDSDAGDFYGRVEWAAPGSSRLSCVHSTAQTTERKFSHLRSDPQELVLVAVQKSGYGFVEQDGRQCRLEPGDFALYDTTRPYRLFFEKPFEQLIVRLPRHLLDRHLPGLPRLTARRYSGQSGAAAVAAGFALHLAANAPTLGDKGLQSFEPATADLIASAIHLQDQGLSDPDRVRFERIQARLARLIRDPMLDIAEVAAREGLSLRSLQRLFQADGTTPTKWVLDRRLDGVSRDLASGLCAQRSITEIAYSWASTISPISTAASVRASASAQKPGVSECATARKAEQALYWAVQAAPLPPPHQCTKSISSRTFDV